MKEFMTYMGLLTVILITTTLLLNVLMGIFVTCLVACITLEFLERGHLKKDMPLKKKA